MSNLKEDINLFFDQFDNFSRIIFIGMYFSIFFLHWFILLTKVFVYFWKLYIYISYEQVYFLLHKDYNTRRIFKFYCDLKFLPFDCLKYVY